MTLDEINMELKDLAAYNLELETQAVYEEMLETMYQDEMIAHFEMQEYAARSYDADAVSYGLQ